MGVSCGSGNVPPVVLRWLSWRLRSLAAGFDTAAVRRAGASTSTDIETPGRIRYASISVKALLGRAYRILFGDRRAGVDGIPTDRS